MGCLDACIWLPEICMSWCCPCLAFCCKAPEEVFFCCRKLLSCYLKSFCCVVINYFCDPSWLFDSLGQYVYDSLYIPGTEHASNCTSTPCGCCRCYNGEKDTTVPKQINASCRAMTCQDSNTGPCCGLVHFLWYTLCQFPCGMCVGFFKCCLNTCFPNPCMCIKG